MRLLPRVVLYGWVVLGFGNGLTPLIAEDELSLPLTATEESAGDWSSDDVLRVASRVDAWIEAEWEASHVIPTDPADDAELLRRVYLDLVGTIPSVFEARAYLADDDPGKARRLVEHLLDDPRHVVHFTNVWRQVLMPEVDADFNILYFGPIFENWLRERLLHNTPYDRLVREIITVPINDADLYSGERVSPLAYYQTKETRPDNLASATARMFLGTRIECAQCHDHPYDVWTREDFWSYAAFFSGLERERGPGGVFAALREIFGSQRLRIPDTDQYVEPRFLGATEPVSLDGRRPRDALADWMTHADNPLFARMAVNRMWAHFFGTGLIDPVDDFMEINPPSHPELLDELAREFVAHDYDLKFLMRVITSTRAYQLSSRQTDPSQSYARKFAVMPLRGLSQAQLYASLSEAIGHFEPFEITNPYINFGNTTPKAEFRELFGEQEENAAQRQTSILQSLLMMNGEMTLQATTLDHSRTLAAIVHFPHFSHEERVEALFLAALTRLPTDEERATFIRYVEEGGVEGSCSQALSDVFWVLLNSTEFRFNH